MTNRFEVVDPEDGEVADVMICAPKTDPLMLPDNLVSTCSMCFRMVQHRPNAPTAPKKVCFDCIKPHMDKESKKGKLTVQVTPKTLSEVADYIAKKRRH